MNVGNDIALPSDWRKQHFGECFGGKPRGIELPQIASRNVQPTGVLPVIGQGQGFVEGFTDEVALRFPDNLLPVIIFGPHTRIIKAIKQPFVSGPNVRYLWPKPQFDFDFATYALKSLRIPSRGYNDHFPLLKEMSLPVPPPSEQRKIASLLGLAQRAKEQQARLVALTGELKKGLLHQLFTNGLRHEPQKQTEIGSVPKSWQITELGKVANLFGGYAFKSEQAIEISNTQLVRMGNLYQNKLDLTRSPIFYPEEFVQRYPRFVLKQGDLIMSLTGTSGKEDYGFTVELKSMSLTLLLNQRIARVDLISDEVSKDFLFYFLLSRKFLDHLYPTAKGMKQANLSTYAMKRLKVPIPSADEQREIAQHFRVVDRKIELHQATLDRMSELFRTLLHELMTARIRVDDVDLAELAANPKD